MKIGIVERSYKFRSVSITSRSEAEARIAAKAIADTLEVVRQCGMDIHTRVMLEISSTKDHEIGDYVFNTHIRFTVVPSSREYGEMVRHTSMDACIELEKEGWGT